MRRRSLVPVALVLAVLAMAGCRPEPALTPEPTPEQTTPVASPSAPDPGVTDPADPSEPGSADAACAAAGGVFQSRQPTVGVDDDPSTWQSIGAPVAVCRFEEGEGESATRLYVDPVTLSSEQPTLAALAYLAQLPVPAEGPAGLCDLLGGASRYGTTEASGGLIAVDGADGESVEACVFADGSFIDTVALAAYSAETVYGVDLSTVFVFDRSALPDLFDVAAG